MLNVLITGATGNVGIEVIKSLQKLSLPLNIVAGVRNAATDSSKLKDHNVRAVNFDVTDPSTFAAAFRNIEVLFLLRPPQISAVKRYFKPLINNAVESSIRHIVFLSVQGVEKSSAIPHNKIEKLITESKIPYTFLRPAYFMQNFTTTLRTDLVSKKRIFLPAGNAKFALIDVRDIGSAATAVITNTASHIGKSYQLTSREKLTFSEMAEKLSEGLGVNISYESPNIFTYYFTKRREKMPAMLILVMIMLHFFPRFQKEPAVTDCVKLITGEYPITFERFIYDNKKLLTQ